MPLYFQDKTKVMRNGKNYLTIFILLVQVVAMATPPSPEPPPPPGLPIEGGLLFLLVSGLIYGVSKKIKKN